MRDAEFDDTQSGQPGRPPPIRPFTWMGAYSPLLMGPLLLLTCVAMFAPDNVLDTWPVAKAFTNLLGKHISWIGNHAVSTNYPQVALLIACMTVCLLIWTTLVFFMQSVVNYPKLLDRQRQYRTVTWGKGLLIAFLGIPLFIFATIFAFALPGDPSWAKGFTTTSRVGLIFLALGAIYSGGLVIGGCLTVFRLLIDLDLRKGN
jgi:hypothetical protein